MAGAALGLPGGQEEDDADQSEDRTRDLAPAHPLVGEPDAQGEGDDQAEGAQRLDDHEGGLVECHGLDDPADSLHGGARQPDGTAQDLDQEARVVPLGLGGECALLLQHGAEGEQERGNDG